jgi:hypothetical protein
VHDEAPQVGNKTALIDQGVRVGARSTTSGATLGKPQQGLALELQRKVSRSLPKAKRPGQREGGHDKQTQRTPSYQKIACIDICPLSLLAS